MTRLMSSLLYGITPLDPVTYVAVPLVLVAATVLASYLPARKAALVEPVARLVSERRCSRSSASLKMTMQP